MPISQSPLEPRDFRVRAFELTTNSAFDPRADSSGSLSVDFEIFRSEKDPRDFQLEMPVRCGDRASLRDTNEPYAISVTATCLFRFDETVADDTISKMIHLNAPSILYGLIRGYVAQATASAAHGTYLLPAFNFVALRRSKFETTVEAGTETASGEGRKPEDWSN